MPALEGAQHLHLDLDRLHCFPHIMNTQHLRPLTQRLPGSLALAMAALRQGAQMLRVHDVGETMQAVKVEMEMLRTL